ncbi:hypothetical protein [Porphyrobacter sp. LM 6]|jgi:hypothetical protein|uniref:hypothetical protein n=1 Tax=Porphyrobacter sp. LM 6 TaxID=1896196 RepID=UPI000863BD4B|nr:hypothetical protein [Porphyrobacter sp. LM 6]AOL93459.1 hypothetical protein BG023_11505 [Porphyrobacter sp. LM 6]
MFEKANPFAATIRGPANGLRPENGADPRRSMPGMADERFGVRDQRRAGGALRAVEWSELTARLNAARDLRLLLRTESQSPIGAVAASFGDAAASYFALLDDSQRDVNHDALGQSKAFGATDENNKANRPDWPSGGSSADNRDAARDMQ